MTMEKLWNIAKTMIQSDLPAVSVPGLKPLPASAEDFKSELASFKNLDRHSKPPPRAKLYHYMLSSAKIRRSIESAMILLVGGSGVGKSSTINNLFDTGGEFEIAMTSCTKSETKATSEYVLSFDEPSFEVCDLKMSVIDTPGFNDTNGVNQDACNFVSIKRFFETHERLPEQHTYPNLVFLVVNATDTRIMGRNSNLSKCLRGVKLLEVVDTKEPNLVIILTFCCSVGHKNVQKWEQNMQEKKDNVSKVVYEVLGVLAPVVLIENNIEEHDLAKDGDFTLLPNGERQPKNLYNACLELLKQNKDHLGLMILNTSFKRARKDLPKNGHETVAKNCNAEALSKEEIEFAEAFSESAKGGLDPLALCAMEYIEENKLSKLEQDEVLNLVKSMKSLRLPDDENWGSLTMGEINCIHGKEVSEHGIRMLEQKFGIQREFTSLNPAECLGQGYNISLNKIVPAQIMVFSTAEKEMFGFRIPTCAQIFKVNETREYQMDFQSDEAYVQSRLENLGLNVELAQSVLSMAPQIGVNISRKSSNSVKSTKTTKTSLIEYRINKICVANFKSKNISFTNDFSSAVKELPNHYTGEKNDKQKLERFFNRFGHFVITSAYIGGAVKVKTCEECSDASESQGTSIGGSFIARAAGLIGIKMSSNDQPSNESATNAVLKTTETQWQGGRSDLHTRSTIECEEKMSLWKMSLSKEPSYLTTEMTVEPISTVVAIIDKKKGEVCNQGLRSIFQNKDPTVVRSLQDELASEARKKREEKKLERLRTECNSRTGSTKEPDIEGWWETITGHALTVGGTLIIIVAAIVVTAFNCQ